MPIAQRITASVASLVGVWLCNHWLCDIANHCKLSQKKEGVRSATNKIQDCV